MNKTNLLRPFEILYCHFELWRRKNWLKLQVAVNDADDGMLQMMLLAIVVWLYAALYFPR